MSSTTTKPVMSAYADFQTWNDNDGGGTSNSYTNAQGQDSLMANDDSLETAANTWVIIFNGKSYTGNCLKIGPSTYLDDLNHTDRYDNSGKKQGDWKNQIQSFILYKQKPDFWDTGSNYTLPTNAELLALHDGQALVTENTGFMGANRTFQAPYNGPNMSSVGYTTNSTHMTGAYAINSLETGPNAWMIIFDDTDCNGNFLKINPSTKYSDLNNVDRNDINGHKQGDWKNQIQSFLLYAYQPEFWGTSYPRPYIDFTTLYDLYPDQTSSVSDDQIEYVVEDSTYEIDEPDFKEQSTTQVLSTLTNDDETNLPTNGWTKYHIYLQHDNPLFVQNDKAEYDAYFDNTGKLVSIQRFEWSSKGAYQVSQEVINTVDFVAWYLGAANTWETLGISDEVAEDFVEAFDFVCSVFNTVANLVYRATDNGGQFYFLPVICHTLNRICTAVTKSMGNSVYINPSDPKNNYVMAFSNAGFPAALTTALQNNGVANNWMQKSSATGKTSTFNQVSEFTYQSNPYRTWYQESSSSSELGMFVSCKIDYEIGDNSKDDHIIILMGFVIPKTGNTPMLSFAQAIIQFTDCTNANIQSNAYANDNIINDVYNDLKSKLSGITIASNQQGRHYLAEVAKANMDAINACTSYGA